MKEADKRYLAIMGVVDRFEREYGNALGGKLAMYMDIDYSGVDYDALMTADKSTFAHDCYGISAHMDRENGKLVNGFVPRVGFRKEV